MSNERLVAKMLDKASGIIPAFWLKHRCRIPRGTPYRQNAR